MGTQATPYGQCTEKEPYSASTTRVRGRCPRPATGDDGLCWPHRAGKQRAEEARAAAISESEE